MQANPSPADEVVDLREYAAVLRRRFWLVVIVTTLFVSLAAAYSFTRSPAYTAQSEVLVQPTSTSSQFRPDQLVSLDTEARIVRSAQVAEMARTELGWNITVPELLKLVSVETTPETLVLDIFFTDPTPTRAASGANAFADAYLSYKRQRATQAASATRQAIQSQIDDLKRQRDKLDETIDAASAGSSELADAQQERDTVNGQIAVLTSQLAQVPAVLDPGEVILPATPPFAPSSPKHPLNLAMGLLLGGFLGVIIAFARDRTDERISGRSDLEATLDAPVLAAIPKVVGWSKRGPVWLVTEQQPRSPAAEAYRTLRTAVIAMSRKRDLKVFAITSPILGEGKSTTTANLAAALSHTDNRVLVISADLRRPSLHRYFQRGNELGLSDVLLGEIPIEEALTPVSSNLWVLTSGRPPARPAELLQSNRMAELIDRARDRFDFVIIDCPPVLGLADTLAIVPGVDAVFLVARQETSKRSSILHAADQLGQVGASVRGGILNDVALGKRGSSYGYGYGYGYGKENAPESERAPSARSERARRRAEPMGADEPSSTPVGAAESLNGGSVASQRVEVDERNSTIAGGAIPEQAPTESATPGIREP
jgi:capsular exopolysaccharide synthesis family protein